MEGAVCQRYRGGQAKCGGNTLGVLWLRGVEGRGTVQPAGPRECHIEGSCDDSILVREDLGGAGTVGVRGSGCLDLMIIIIALNACLSVQHGSDRLHEFHSSILHNSMDLAFTNFDSHVIRCFDNMRVMLSEHLITLT